VIYLAKKVSGESKLFAFLSYFFGFIGFIIVLLARKNDKYAMYHAKQSLVLNISAIIIYVCGWFIPVIGWFIILPLGYLFIAILWIIGIIRALTGSEKPLPWIGKYGENLKL
jgi:uncharacterized membrane protein